MATALNMTDSEMEQRAYAAALCRNAAMNCDDTNKDKDELLINVRKVAKVLHHQYGAVRVVLFGSLAYGARWWREASDIDLAVEGLTGKNYWRAWKTVEEMLPGRTVDLVDFDMATNSLKMAIDHYGLEL
jgi:predicted nucleotidyltransferase